MSVRKISNLNAGFIIGTALLFDGLQFVLTLTIIGTVVSWFVALVAWILFLLWFGLLGMNYMGKGAALRLGTIAGSAVTELLPFVNAIPAITMGVVVLIVQNRVEYAKQEEEQGKKRGGGVLGTVGTVAMFVPGGQAVGAAAKGAVAARAVSAASRTGGAVKGTQAREAAVLARYARRKAASSNLMEAGRAARRARGMRAPQASPRSQDQYRESAEDAA